MSPLTTTTSTTIVINNAVPIRNRTNRFVSGRLGRSNKTPAQPAMGNAIQPTLVFPKNLSASTASTNKTTAPSIHRAYGLSFRSAETGVVAIHSRVSHAIHATTINKKTSQWVRYEKIGVKGPLHGSSLLYAWAYQVLYGI